ncbi:M1 family metallopeptidase [Candidatus Fermentibacteria bacterium]|nr:M1 family metallopeptidase [Candidatus Fermentibacteria bacterium]
MLSIRALSVVLLCAATAYAGPRAPIHSFSPPPTHREDRTPTLDVLHYALDIALLPETRELHGIASITMRALGEELGEIPLDLAVLSVQGVTEGEEIVPFATTDDGVLLQPAVPLQPGQPRTFVLQYGGLPGNEGGSSPWGGFFFSGNMAYSVGVGLYADPPSMGRFWFPGHDVPGDKATADITLRVPAEWLGIANGAIVSDSLEGSTRVMRWATELPIATYLMAIAAGPYVEVADSGTVPIRHYVLPSQVDRARASFIHVPQMIELYSRLFGPYPFERFGYVSSNLSGGMEHQTMVTLGSFAINGLLTWETLIAHELSHQWWGDCVTYQDWTQIWLSEGFATYSEALWAEEIDGHAAYVASVHQMMQEYLGSGEDYFPLNEPDVLWGNATYEKGACVVHMLRQVLGDSLFYSGLATYRAQHEYGNATVDSLELSLGEAAGLNLQWFFDQWVRSPGHPELAFRLTTYPFLNGDTGIELEVSQLQDIGPVFRFPFRCAVDCADTTVWMTFLDSLPVQVGSVRVQGPVTDIRLDPEHDLLFRNLGMSTSDRLLLDHMLVVDDGDMDGGLDPGETADIFVGILNPFSTLGAVVIELVCDDPAIAIIEGTVTLDSLAGGSVSTTISDPFRIQASPSVAHTMQASLRVITEEDALISVPITLHLGTAIRLLVDDGGTGDSYAPYFLAALDTLPDGHDRELWAVHRQGCPSPARLSKYADRGMVTWFTGDVASSALDDDEIEALKALLDAGGSLFLTGQNAVDDLPLSLPGQAFLNDYLKVSVVDLSCNTTRAVMGIDGDPIGNGVMGVIQGSGGADNQTSLTVIAPLEGADPAIYYRNTDFVCAARAADRGRAVVFSFGFEALNETQSQFTSREEMIRRVADWLEGPGTGVSSVPAPRFTLWSPSPWRGPGRISLWLPAASSVQIALYDLAGRQARTVHRGVLPEGVSSLGMPEGIPPGAYLLVARTETQAARSPVIIIP